MPNSANIPVSSAVRRLAEALLLEEMEKDSSLCQTPSSFRDFLAHILDRTPASQKTITTTTAISTSSSESSSSGKQSSSSTSSSIQSSPHGHGALTDDADNFSKKCGETRVTAVSRAQKIVNNVVSSRQQQQQQQQQQNQQQQEEKQIPSSNVVTLSEWKLICREHPFLLKSALERAMPRSETTATALVADLPINIIGIRDESRTARLVRDTDDDQKKKNISEEGTTKQQHQMQKKDQQEEENAKSDEKNEQNNNNNSNKKEKEEEEDDDDKKENSSSSTDKVTAYMSSAAFSTWTYATDWAQRVHQWVERFITGGIAGGVAKTVIAPGDRVKIIFQVNRKMAFSLGAAYAVANQIVSRSGVMGLWAGHGATLLRVVPYASISFASFEFYHISFKQLLLSEEELNAEQSKVKTKFDGAGSKRQILVRFLAGAGAGATATVFTFPLDLLRARYAAYSLNNHGKPYPSYWIGLKTIYGVNGVRSLYSGIWPTLAGIIPYAGTSFTVFETLKAFVLSRSPTGLEGEKQTELATWQRLVSGGMAGMIAQSATYPLDIVRRRMQVHPEEHRSMFQTLMTIYREEGVRRGLYKGLSMNWIKGPIAVAVSFTINDYMKSRIQKYHADQALELSKKEIEKQQQIDLSQQQQQQQDNSNKNKSSSTSTNSNNNNVIKNPNKNLHIVERFVCGAAASVAAKIWTVPVDRLKLMMALGRVQNDGSPGYNLRTVLQLLSETRNPWQGSFGVLLRIAPYGAISYTMFDASQNFAQHLVFMREPSFFSDMIAGSIAGAVATICLHPVDVIRSKFALATPDAPPPFASYVQGLKNESLSSLYSGVRPALAGVCPLAALSFAVYHAGKRNYDDGSFSCRLLLGAGAGIVGQIFSFPLNIVRRKALVEEQVSESVLKSLRHEILQHGDGGSRTLFSSMYRRMPLGWSFGTMTMALSFAVHDHLRDRLVDVKKRQARDLLLKDPTTLF